MFISRILINILLTVTKCATTIDVNQCNEAYISDEIFHKAAKEIMTIVKYPFNVPLKVKSLINKEYELTRIHKGKNAHFFEIKTNDKRNVIKYLASAKSNYNEVNMYSKIKNENIVKMYKSYIYRPGKGYFLLMEPMDGSISIQYAIQFPKEIKSIVKSIAEALIYLQTKNIYHNNIRLENVLYKTVDNKKIYKLCDFRLARKSYDDPKDSILFNEDDMYTAPETIRCSTINAKTDIWMLGRLINFYKNKEIMHNKPDSKGWENPCEYFRYISELEKEQENGKSKDGIINQCCAVNPDSRSSLEAIIQWCAQEELNN